LNTKKIGHILIVVMILSLLISPLPVSMVSASDAVSVSLELPDGVKAGNSFDVYVKISAVSHLGSWGFDLTYDNQVVQVNGLQCQTSGVSAGYLGTTELTNTWSSIKYENGEVVGGTAGEPVTWNIIRVGGALDPRFPATWAGTDPSYIAVVHFKVLEGVADGATSALTFSKYYMGDEKAKAISPVSWQDGVLTVDEDPPAVPTGLNAANPVNGRVWLTWFANADEIASYKLYSSANGGITWDAGVTIPATATSYTKTGLTNGITYTFGLTALDDAGNESALSDTVEAVPQSDTVAPSVPGGLTAIPGDEQVTLNWNANSETDLANYQVFQSEDNGTTWNSGVLLDSSETAFVATGLTNQTEYTFGVSALDFGGNVSLKSTISSTPVGPPEINISTPAEVEQSSAFDLYVSVDDIYHLSAWGFNLTYDSTKVQVIGHQNDTTGVTAGSIAGVPMPVLVWVSFPNSNLSGTVLPNGNTIRVGGALSLATYPTGVSVGKTQNYLAVVHLQLLPGAQVGDILPFQVNSLGLYDYLAHEITNVTANSGQVEVRQELNPPSITSVFPADGAKNIATNTTVRAYFSEAMNNATINNTNFSLIYSDNDSTVDGTVNYDTSDPSHVAVFTPEVDLAANTRYTATVTTGVQDLAGNALQEDYSWSFTSGSLPDTEGPSVTGISFLKNPQGAYINTSIKATFSEPLDPATLNTASYQLWRGADAVAGSISYSGVEGIFDPDVELENNTTYTIKITTAITDVYANPMVNQFELSFNTSDIIYEEPLQVSSTSPANNEKNVAVNRSIVMTFSQPLKSISADNFTLKHGATSVSGTLTAWENNAIFNPDSDLSYSTIYTATLTAGIRDLGDNQLESDYSWTFTTGDQSYYDDTPPEVSSTYPANGAVNVALNKAVTATFTEVMDALTISTSSFTLTKLADNSLVAGLLTYSDTTATFKFEARSGDLAPDTQYQGKVTTAVADLAGNHMLDNYTWTFTTGALPDITPPQVSSTIPRDNATLVDLDQAISATFTEPVESTTITTATFTLNKQTTSGPEAVKGTVNYYGKTAVFTPRENLASSTLYSAIISADVVDLAGNALAGNQDNGTYIWSFTTGSAKDTVRPTVTYTDPKRDEIGVGVNHGVSATFSEPMKEVTITTANFTLYNNGENGTAVGVKVAGAVHYSGTTATFIPLVNLEGNKWYTATIINNVCDLAGNTLLENYSWAFKTGSDPDIIHPLVSSTSPYDNETEVALNRDITATFSEPMNPDTITTDSFILEKVVDNTTFVRIAGSVKYSVTTATYMLVANLDVESYYRATITSDVTDMAGLNLEDNYTWLFKTGTGVDNEKPTVSSTIPADGATAVPIDSAINAYFSENMDTATVTNQSFTLWQNTTQIAGTVACYGATAVFTPESNLVAKKLITARISTEVADLAGNHMASEKTWTFTTGDKPDTEKPTVIYTDPADGDDNVSTNGNVIATFSEAMDPETINPETFILNKIVEGQDPVSVPGTVEYYVTTATYRLKANLDNFTNYQATITTGVADSAGNHMAADKVWSFTTGGAMDKEAPYIVTGGRSPASGATGVKVTTNVIVTFNESLAVATVNTSTFKLYKVGSSSNTAVAGAVTYNPATFTVTFDPTANLSSGTIKYLVVISNGVKDLANNAFAGDSWNFTTVANSNPGPGPGSSGGTSVIRPYINSTSPADQATAVDVNIPVTAVFSTAMNSGTINNTTFTLKSDKGAVAGVVTYTVATKIATFTPSSPLAYSTTYTANISKEVSDPSGIGMVKDYAWTFTTMPVPEVIVTLSGFTTGQIVLDSNGLLKSAANLKTTDGAISISIAQGTKMINSDKTPLRNLSVSPAKDLPTAPAGNAIVAAYTFGETGANFNPALTLTFNYQSMKLPAGVSEKDLKVYIWSGSDWIVLSGAVDTQNKTITVSASHFSIYGLIGKQTPVTSVTTTTTKPTVPPTSVTTQPVIPPTSPSVTPPVSPEPEPSGFPVWAIILIIVVVIAIVVVIILVLRKRQFKFH
jgi:hypothetical protein